jgi:hypothetical protein
MQVGAFEDSDGEMYRYKSATGEVSDFEDGSYYRFDQAHIEQTGDDDSIIIGNDLMSVRKASDSGIEDAGNIDEAYTRDPYISGGPGGGDPFA